MALKKPTNAVPAFETEDDIVDTQDVQVEDVQIENETPQTSQDEPAVAQPLPVAKVQAKALTAVGNKFQTAFKEYHNQIDLETVADIGQGSMPKVTVDRGGFEVEKKELGENITIELVSFNDRYVLTPGVDGEEAKKLVKYSYDGVHVADDSGMLVKDYIDFLKEEGYPRAEAKRYIDLWAMLMSSDKTGDIAEDDRELVQVQLSPTSVKEWSKMLLQASIKANRLKKELHPFLKLTADKREFNGNKFATIKFAVAN